VAITDAYGAECTPTPATPQTSRSSAQEAHEAIPPTLPLLVPAPTQEQRLSIDDRATVMAWMPLSARATIGISNPFFKRPALRSTASGEVITFEGFRKPAPWA
jgi:DNA topoisomerase IA